ncbi:MAG: AmmeMemoRadiSam system protein B [Spirochaetaceae bacterium]
MKEMIKVRQPIVEGLFYPSDPKQLTDKINLLLESNKTEQQNGSTIIIPHGGWDYTGDYIATGLNSITQKQYKKVIIISNVHRELSNTITLPEAEYFLIAGKKIKVDLNDIKKIKKIGKKVNISNIQHMEEHGIETILPFINHLYPEAKIVPILLGKTIVSLVRNLSNIITEIKDRDTLLIISSNFSGYEKEQVSLDIGKLGIELTTNGKMADLVELTRTNKLKTCGAGAISSALLLADYKNIEVLKEGLTEQSSLSGGKATYYGTLIFR